jgi:ATP/maltotriose-dependent transcriptional regulator MalT
VLVPGARKTDAFARERRKSPPSKTQEPLTERELDVVHYLPTRLTTLGIANQLEISPNTIKTHLKHIYQKLGARSRDDAILKAVRLHMLPEAATILLGAPEPVGT